MKRGRIFIRDADVAVPGTVRVNTVNGGHLTGQCVRKTLKVEEANRYVTREQAEMRANAAAERRDDAARILSLAPHR